MFETLTGYCLTHKLVANDSLLFNLLYFSLNTTVCPIPRDPFNITNTSLVLTSDASHILNVPAD